MFPTKGLPDCGTDIHETVPYNMLFLTDENKRQTCVALFNEHDIDEGGGGYMCSVYIKGI